MWSILKGSVSLPAPTDLAAAGKIIAAAVNADPALADKLVPGYRLTSAMSRSERSAFTIPKAVRARKAALDDHARRTIAEIAGIREDFPSARHEKIADELNAAGARTSRGLAWDRRRIGAFLRRYE